MYGKVMSIPDVLMGDYFEFATDVAGEDLRRLRRELQEGALHPRDAKRRLAREIVRLWHGAEAATAAETAFDRVFRAKDLPEEIPEVRLPGLRASGGVRRKATRLLVELRLAKSQSEARRLVSQGGVVVDGQRVGDAEFEIEVRDGMVVRVGKRRFARVRAEHP
jgi:tyrosyl-tRNA synthetase